MDSFELNKIIGALLGVVFVIFSVSLISEAVFHSPAPETPGYAIVVPESGAAEEDAGEEAPESVLPLLAAADPSAGENVFKRCQACHTPEEGGPNKVGPNLWGVVGRPIASHEGFSYSAALQEFSQGGEAVWDYEHLDHFLTDPKGLVPGTAMSFAGLKNVEDRANVIAYLRTLSAEPVPLPEVPAEGEGEAAGEGADAAADGAQAAPAESDAQATEEAAPAGEATQSEPAEQDAATEPASDEPAEGETPAESTEETAPAGEATQSEPAEEDTATEPTPDAPAAGEAEAPAGEAEPVPADE